MPENPYSSSGVEAQPRDSTGMSVGAVVREILKYLGAYLVGSPRLRRWRPLWLGFPIGFIGTLGVYYTAAASI